MRVEKSSAGGEGEASAPTPAWKNNATNVRRECIFDCGESRSYDQIMSKADPISTNTGGGRDDLRQMVV